MIGRAVPEQDQRLVGPFGPQPLQDIDGVLAVGAGIGPEPHLAFVVEVEAIERQLVGQARRMRADPEALAARRPAIAEAGILVDVRLIKVDQQMPVVLGALQQILRLREERLPPLRIGSAEQLAGLLPRQLQPVQGTADRLTAAATTKLSATQPTKRRKVQRGAGSAPASGRRRGLLGGADDLAEPGLDLGQKGGGHRCAERSAPRGRACCRGAATPSRSAGGGGCAPPPAWRSSPG